MRRIYWGLTGGKSHFEAALPPPAGRPVVGQKYSVFGQKHPVFGQKHSVVGQSQHVVPRGGLAVAEEYHVLPGG